MTDYEIVVVDTVPKRFPGAKQLVALGVPVRVARRWEQVRREFTRGLKQRIEEGKN